MSQEVEIKFEVGSPQLASFQDPPLPSGWNAEAPAAKRLISVYYDTPDLALRERRVGFRVRAVNGGWRQTVKADSAGGGFFQREEHEIELTGQRPDFDALRGSAFEALFADADLRERMKPVFTTDFQRTKRILRDGGSTSVEMALDEGAVFTDAARAPIAELEMELLSGRPAVLIDLALAFAKAAPLRLSSVSKAARGYALVRPETAVAQAPATESVNGASLKDRLRADLVCLFANERAATGPQGARALEYAKQLMARMASAMARRAERLEAEAGQALADDAAWLARAADAPETAFASPRYTVCLLGLMSWLYGD